MTEVMQGFFFLSVDTLNSKLPSGVTENNLFVCMYVGIGWMSITGMVLLPLYSMNEFVLKQG